MTHDESVHGDASSERSGPPIKLILFLLLVIALAVFFFQNTSDTRIEFLWIDVTWPLWTVIGASAVTGAILAKLAGWSWARSRERR